MIGAEACIPNTDPPVCATCKWDGTIKFGGKYPKTLGWNFKKMRCILCGDEVGDAVVQEAGQAVKVPEQFDQLFCPGLTYPIALDENYMIPVHLYPVETRRFSGQGK